ncbi:tripartite motif-containing protein 16-like isoform X2 [Nerophis lumbriciformis]|uniref:tripartite motif-containing protein 16-like isoform X2 n=1 Tax=Nerophis lumbriciformis TaxID=546530 RepID=UPI002ADFC3C2|nr:tripartite motif-containing protein 16-like isoform X2 [Nerophis lumbriciformis]
MTTTNSPEDFSMENNTGDRTTDMQDVPCDSCMSDPRKAVKSCMTCLVSFCADHLRPHLVNVRFQSHRLVEPRHRVDGETCERHHLPLERYCLTHGCCLCSDCQGQGHAGHATASLGEARAHIENELQQKHREMDQSVSATDKAMEKLHSNKERMKAAVQEVLCEVEQQFVRLQEAVGEVRKKATEQLEAEQRRALRQARGVEAHLKQRRAELAKTLAEMNKMARIQSDVSFLQEYSLWKEGAPDVCLPDVRFNNMERVNAYVQVVASVTQELRDLLLTSYQDKLSIITDAKNLTFDPDSAHHFLRLTVDNTKATNTSPWQHGYVDHPDRFEHWRQAVTSQSLYTGRHYVEAELIGEGAHVGVTYKSIERKGQETSSCITGNNFSWCVGRNSRGLSAWHAGAETPLEAPDVTKIGVYVDFHGGHVGFYDVRGPVTLLHRYWADFMEPLHVAAWLSKKENVVQLMNNTNP